MTNKTTFSSHHTLLSSFFQATQMEWTKGRVLGRGSSATVSAATSTLGDVFAVKSVEFSRSGSLQKEQHFLSMLRSPYVVGYKGCDITIEENQMVYNIFIDYMSGGSIVDSINRRNGEGFTNSEIAIYTRQIVQGLEYIHSNGVVHCDIKGGNILLQDNGIAKIGDFGCAKRADQTSPISGTPMFMAPEVARGEEQRFPADIWAFGCTVIEMTTGVSPWPNVYDPVSVLYRIAFSGEIPKIPDVLSDQAKDFISKCLIRDPKHRWTAKMLLEHAFIQQFDENPNQILCDKLSTNSPTSILDQDVWNSIEQSPSSSSSPGSVEFAQQNSLLNSARQRVEQLICNLKMPYCGCEEEEKEWVMVRINEAGDRWR